MSAVMAMARGLLVTALAAITWKQTIQLRSEKPILIGHLSSGQLDSLGHLLGSGVALPGLLGVDGEQDHLGLELLQPLCVQLQRLHTLVPRGQPLQKESLE